jgi:hypothetical protein
MSELMMMGKLRTGMKTTRFSEEGPVIYVRKSVLDAINEASTILEKAQKAGSTWSSLGCLPVPDLVRRASW